MPKSLSYFKVVTFCLFCSFCVKKLLHFTLKGCYILRQKLLHFALMLHFASIVTFWSITAFHCSSWLEDLRNIFKPCFLKVYKLCLPIVCDESTLVHWFNPLRMMALVLSDRLHFCRSWQHRAVNKGWGPGISSGFHEYIPRLLP